MSEYLDDNNKDLNIDFNDIKPEMDKKYINLTEKFMKFCFPEVEEKLFKLLLC
jgi:hypothetical protein